jgi:hypothetical protein
MSQNIILNINIILLFLTAHLLLRNIMVLLELLHSLQ